MEILDIIIIIIIGLVGLKCYFMGFTRSIWGLAAIVSGIFIASRTWTYLAGSLQPLIKNQLWTKIISMIIIAVGVAVIINFLFRKLYAIVQEGVISWIDDALGVVFGVVLASFLIGGIFILLQRYASESIQKIIVQSKLAPYLIDFTKYVVGSGKDVVEKSKGMPL